MRSSQARKAIFFRTPKAGTSDGSHTSQHATCGDDRRSWFTVITKIIVPNIKSALISAAFISIALVLGEFTFASLLNFNTLQVTINQQGKSNAQVSVAAPAGPVQRGHYLSKVEVFEPQGCVPVLAGPTPPPI